MVAFFLCLRWKTECESKKRVHWRNSALHLLCTFILISDMFCRCWQYICKGKQQLTFLQADNAAKQPPTVWVTAEDFFKDTWGHFHLFLSQPTILSWEVEPSPSVIMANNWKNILKNFPAKPWCWSVFLCLKLTRPCPHSYSWKIENSIPTNVKLQHEETCILNLFVVLQKHLLWWLGRVKRWHDVNNRQDCESLDDAGVSHQPHLSWRSSRWWVTSIVIM